MKSELITILEALGYPVYLQGSIGEHEDYPESFFTFWNFETPEKFYDNGPINAVWGFWVNFFSTDPEAVEKVTAQVIKKLRVAGWILEGRGEDAASDEPSYTGRRLTVYKREVYKEENHE